MRLFEASLLLLLRSEVWPGSHRDAGGLIERDAEGNWPITPEFEARRREIAPPIRVCCPLGAVAFRDHRLVHRGVPNWTPLMRQMVSLNYGAKSLWDEPDLHHRRSIFQGFGADLVAAGDLSFDDLEQEDWRLVFPAECRAAFARPSQHGVLRNVRFIEGRVNHLGGVFAPGGAVPHAAMALLSHDMRTGHPAASL